jgi:hypothetical protein
MTEPTLVLDKPDANNPVAPWGYEDDDITPRAPLGYKADGTPRISNRGRKTGPGTPRARTNNSGKKRRSSSADQASMLATIIDMMVVVPLAGASKSELVTKRIGPKHTAALAGDAAIINHYRDPLINGVMILAQAKPGVLAWMDTMEEKAPWLILAKVGADIATAIVKNHMSPDEQLAERGMETAQTAVDAMQNAA